MTLIKPKDIDMPSIKEPMEKFYVGYRELFEKPRRKGYTKNINEAGVFSFKEARNMTEFPCADDYGRWFISCEALKSFDGKKLNPKEMY